MKLDALEYIVTAPELETYSVQCSFFYISTLLSTEIWVVCDLVRTAAVNLFLQWHLNGMGLCGYQVY